MGRFNGISRYIMKFLLYSIEYFIFICREKIIALSGCNKLIEYILIRFVMPSEEEVAAALLIIEIMIARVPIAISLIVAATAVAVLVRRIISKIRLYIYRYIYIEYLKNRNQIEH